MKEMWMAIIVVLAFLSGYIIGRGIVVGKIKSEIARITKVIENFETQNRYLTTDLTEAEFKLTPVQKHFTIWSQYKSVLTSLNILKANI